MYTIAQLEVMAADAYPYRERMCSSVKTRIDWLRIKYVRNKLKEQGDNTKYLPVNS